MYGYTCEYCQARTKKIVEREAFKHKRGFVILEHVPLAFVNLGSILSCGASSSVEDIASQKKPAERMNRSCRYCRINSDKA